MADSDSVRRQQRAAASLILLLTSLIVTWPVSAGLISGRIDQPGSFAGRGLQVSFTELDSVCSASRGELSLETTTNDAGRYAVELNSVRSWRMTVGLRAGREISRVIAPPLFAERQPRLDLPVLRSADIELVDERGNPFAGVAVRLPGLALHHGYHLEALDVVTSELGAAKAALSADELDGLSATGLEILSMRAERRKVVVVARASGAAQSRAEAIPRGLPTVSTTVVDDRGTAVQGAVLWQAERPDCFAVTTDDGTAGWQPGRGATLAGAIGFDISRIEPDSASTRLTRTRGILTGRVVDSLGNPIEDSLATWASGARLGVTDAGGRFVIRGVRANLWQQLNLSAPGFLDEKVELAAVLEDQLDEVSHRWSLSRPTAVSGRLVDESSRPAAGLRVSLAGAGDVATETDERGSYRLEGVPAGKQLILVEQNGEIVWLTSVAPDGGGSPLDLGTIRLTETTTVWGQVTDQDGTAVDEVLVLADLAPAAAGSAAVDRRGKPLLPELLRTDSGGFFEIGGIPVDSIVTVGFSKKGFASVSKRISTSGEMEPVEVVLPRLKELTVRVVSASDGAPLPQTYLRVDRGIPEGLGPTWASRGWSTDESGEATFEVYPGRQGKVEALLTGYVGRTKTLEFSDEPRQLEEIELSPSAVLEGIVLEPDGAPAAGLRFSLLGRRAGTFSQPGGERRADEQGRFTLDGVETGELSLRFFSPRHGAQDRTVQVREGLNEIEFLLEQGRSFHLEGVAVGEQGRPVANLTLSAFHLETHEQWSVVLDTSGSFSFAGMPEGRYSLSCRGPGRDVRVLGGKTLDLGSDISDWEVVVEIAD